MRYKCINDGFIFTVKEGSQFQELLDSDKGYELILEEETKDFSVSEIKKMLSEKGIEYSKGAKKEELIKLLNEASNGQDSTSEVTDKRQDD